MNCGGLFGAGGCISSRFGFFFFLWLVALELVRVLQVTVLGSKEGERSVKEGPTWKPRFVRGESLCLYCASAGWAKARSHAVESRAHRCIPSQTMQNADRGNERDHRPQRGECHAAPASVPQWLQPQKLKKKRNQAYWDALIPVRVSLWDCVDSPSHLATGPHVLILPDIAQFDRSSLLETSHISTQQ